MGLQQNAYHNIKLSSRRSCTTRLPSSQEKPPFPRLPTFRKSIQTKKPALRLRKGTPRVFSSSVTYVWAAFSRAWLALRYTWLIQSDQKEKTKKKKKKSQFAKNSDLFNFPKYSQCLFPFHPLPPILVFCFLKEQKGGQELFSGFTSVQNNIFPFLRKLPYIHSS